jgi:hypothetical protein
VSNSGTAAARTVAVAISLVVSGTPSQVATINVGTLAAGASSVVASTLSAPTTPGAYPVIAKATTTDAESNSSNNTTSASLRVVASTPSGCDYYAAPGGTGNGASPSTPFRVVDFWAVARPGVTLCLLDGVYTGRQSMIIPSAGMSGTSNQPITIRALNDGAVTIDGQFAHYPLHLSGNNWWVFEGFNAHSSVEEVVRIRSSSNNIFRRMVAWDAHIDANAGVWSLAVNSSNNLFEDIAGFGTARKVVTFHSGSNDNTMRRGWFRWEGATQGGNYAVSMTYKTYRNTFENILATWSGESLPDSYDCNLGAIVPKTNGRACSARAVVGMDRLEDATVPKHAHVTLRGSIAYFKAADKIPQSSLGEVGGGLFMSLLSTYGTSSNTYSDVIAVTSPSNVNFNNIHALSLRRRPLNGPIRESNDTDPVVNNILIRATTITGNEPAGSGFTGTGYQLHPDWTVTGHSTGRSLAAVQTPWQNTSSTGARLCYRTVDGVTGPTPLWPWPMNDRIKSATAAAGRYTGPCTANCVGGRAARTPTDVTADLETLLGPIPTSCRR